MFPTVAIIGIGLVGGSLGMALLRRNLADAVIGIDARPEAIAAARDVGACSRASGDLVDAAAADLVVLATYLREFPLLVERLGPMLRPGALITDVASVKLPVEHEVVPLVPGPCGILPGHPIAGGTGRGVNGARADLFEGRPWVLCPAGRETLDQRQGLVELVRALGSRPVVLPAAVHDSAVARTSHAPHILAAALAKVVAAGELETRRSLVGAGFETTCRVAGGSEELWRDICLANRSEVAAALRDLESALVAARLAVEGGDAESLLRFFKEGRTAYEALVADPAGSVGSTDG